jgi:hypothetical protein
LRGNKFAQVHSLLIAQLRRPARALRKKGDGENDESGFALVLGAFANRWVLKADKQISGNFGFRPSTNSSNGLGSGLRDGTGLG